MASVLEELVIQLRADDGALRSELQKILNDAKRTGDDMGRAFTPGQQALKRMSDEVRAGLRPLREYRDALAAQERELRATAEAQDRTSKEYRQTVSELAGVRAELISVNRELQNQQTALERVGQAMSRTGGMLSLTVTAPLVALGTQIVRTSADFETSMNRVRALSGAAGADFDKLRQQARDLGATTVFSASEAADAMGFLAMAGFEVEQIYASMPATLSLAAAAQLDMASSADIVSNILTGFNMPVNQLTGAVDVLTKAFTSANTDLTQLGDGMTYVGPIASGLGVSFEETTAALGALSNAGIQGGMAGTSLRRILSTLASDAGNLGVTVYDAAGNMRPLADIIDDLNAKGMTTADTLEHFGDRGGPAMQALLTQGGQALRDFTSELENAGGTADEIAKIQMEGFAGQLKELQSVLQEFMLSLGDAGLLGFLTRASARLRDAVQAFNELSDGAKTTILVVGGIAAGIGPALLILGRLAGAVRSVQAAFVSLRVVALAMTGPAGWITLATVGLGALAISLSGRRDSLDERFEQAAEAAERAEEALESMRDESDTTKTAIEQLTEATDEDGLRGAMELMASTLEGEAKQAFVTLAGQAIVSGGEIQTVAQTIMQLFAAMRQEALDAEVESLGALARVARAQAEAASREVREAGTMLDAVIAEHEATLARAAEHGVRTPDMDAIAFGHMPSSAEVEHAGTELARLKQLAIDSTETADAARAAWEASTEAEVAYSMAIARRDRNRMFTEGEIDSPFLDISTLVPTVTPSRSTDVDDPEETVTRVRDGAGEASKELEAVEDASIRTAATASELFEALEREGAVVVRQVAQLGGTADLEMQGVEMRVGLLRAALERAWDLEDITSDQFAYLEARLAELLSELEEAPARFPRLKTQPQPDEAGTVFPWDSWRHWQNNQTRTPGLGSAVRASRLQPEEGTFSPAPEFGRFAFQSLQAMQPLLEDFDRGWERVVNRAHYLGEEVDFTNERLRLLNTLILGAADMGVPREHLTQWVDEYEVLRSGLEAGQTWGENFGRGVAGMLSRGLGFLQGIADGDITLLPEEHLIDQANLELVGELAEHVERLTSTPLSPLDELKESLQAIAEQGGEAGEQAQLLLEQITAFQDAAAAAEAQEDRVNRFNEAVREANAILGITQDRTSLTIENLEALAAEFDDGTDSGREMAEALQELIDKLRELKEETEDAAEEVESDVSRMATGFQNASQFAAGLGRDFTRAAAQIATGLDEIAEAESVEEKLGGIAKVINGITTAVEGLKAAAERGMGGNDIIDLVGGIAGVASEIIGTLTGIPGLGQVVTAAFSLLNAVIGDLSNGLAQVDQQVQDLTRSSRYMGEELTETFKERFTRQVSRGGIAGSFGATKAELNEEAFTAAVNLAESFGSMLEQALRTGDFESGWNDAILDAMIEAFTMSEEIQQLILDMVDFWNKAWEDGVWSDEEDAEWRRMQERWQRKGEEERQRYIDAGLIEEDDDENNRRRRRTGGSRITELTGPARDHFSDLLAPLAHIGAGVSTLQEIRNILAERLGRPPMLGTNPVPGSGQLLQGAGQDLIQVLGPVHITSSATNASDLLREVGRALQRKGRGS